MDTCIAGWGIAIAIIGSNIALASIFVGVMLWAFSKLDSDIKALGTKLENDMRAQTKRTDQLYQMFIDLLKAQNPKTDP